MSKRLALLVPTVVILGSAGVVGWEGAGSLGRMADRLDGLERESLRETRREAELEARLARLDTELSGFRAELARRAAAAEAKVVRAEVAELAGRLGSAEDLLTEIEGAMDLQSRALASLREQRDALDPEIVEAQFATLDEQLRDRWEDAFELASTAAELAGESRERIERIATELEQRSDHDAMWRELVAPVAQLAGEESVGSGVLLRSIEADEGWATYVLTAWHVVRDIQGDLDHTDMPVPVSIFGRDGATQEETATLLAFEPGLDVALLRLDTDRRVAYGARLAPRSVMQDLAVFDRIYAVGCPLGNAPMPTPGEIAAGHHYVDGEVYVLINAPTYVGNSGGGIFSEDRRELLGIFSKVYTHGAVRPTIVTHMGLITPMDAVYDWLRSVGHGDLEPAGE